jgi:putative ABC transport system permease protein
MIMALVSGRQAVVTGPAWLAFASAFFTMLTFAVVCPVVTRLVSRLLGRIKESHAQTKFRGQLRAMWRIAAERLGRSARRNSITAAALAMAVAMTIGLTVMIHSFRETVLQWVGQTVGADLYIAPASNETLGLDAVIPDEAVEWVRSKVGAAGLETFREVRVNMLLRDSVQPVLLAVVEGSRRKVELAGTEHEVSGVPDASDRAVVSESFSRRYRVHAGDKLELLSSRGKVEFQVSAIYRDYTRDEGVILLSLSTFTRFWRDDGPQSMAIYVGDKEKLNELEEGFRQRFAPEGEYHLYSNRTLRQRILEIFDATFAVTRGLRFVALVVATLGMGLSVSTLVAERQRETGILRAIGCSRAQVRSLFAVEAAMIGSIAALVGLVCGLALAVVLTWIVNPAFFGWTIGFSVPWGSVLSFCVLVVGVSFIAAWIPAGEAANSSLAETVREE